MVHRRHIVSAVLVFTFSLFLTGCSRQAGPEASLSKKHNSASDLTANAPQPSPVHKKEIVPYIAKFEILTQGTKRIFTDPKYHNQSSEVYLTAEEPSVVRVAAEGVTWADLFESLPMSLDHKCLVTGTGQRFCADKQHQLIFKLNGQEIPQALDQEIKAGNFLEVNYFSLN